jgi:hypothetical protein
MSKKICVLVLALSAAGSLPAVTVGQVDTFEDGTTMGWFVPDPTHPAPPANVPDGGPTGPGDAYLRLTATGLPGAGGRLAVLNESQWSGDYLAAGIKFIVMDVNNFGPDDLDLRLLFEDFDPMVPGPPVNLALSAKAVHVPAGSGWQKVVFPISPADLVLETFGTVIGALMNTDTLRIFHNPDPTFPGPGVGIPRVNVVLGVDNIVAAVPEPGTIPLLAGGILALAAARFRRK